MMYSNDFLGGIVLFIYSFSLDAGYARQLFIRMGIGSGVIAQA